MRLAGKVARTQFVQHSVSNSSAARVARHYIYIYIYIYMYTHTHTEEVVAIQGDVKQVHATGRCLYRYHAM